MNRRNFITALGGAAGTGSLIIGSGAFASTSANRAVAVDVADDDRAYLRLEPLVDEGRQGYPTRRSFTPGSEVAFEIPGNGNGENSNAEGMGLDSIYEFHNLLRIENQGTQIVEVYSTYNGEDLDDLALVRDNGILRETRPTIDVGEHIDVGFYIDTQESGIAEYDETLTIVAEAPDG